MSEEVKGADSSGTNGVLNGSGDDDKAAYRPVEIDAVRKYVV